MTDRGIAFVTDRGMWWGAIDWAQRKVAAGAAPVYVYRFDFASAALGEIFGAMHGGEIPFVFNNYALTPVAGDRPENAQVGHVISEAFVRIFHRRLHRARMLNGPAGSWITQHRNPGCNH